MKKSLFVVFSLLIVASMLLTACQPQVVETVKTVVVTQEVVKEGETVIETVVQTVIVTPEPAPVEAGPKAVRINLGPGDVPTLDPALASDTSSVQIIRETHVGLTNQDEVTNELQPGLAESWDVVNNDDGTSTVTFHLRTDVPWVKWDGSAVVQVPDCDGNPRMVKAGDFAYGILRMLNPATASDYAYVSVFALKGSGAFNSGETDDPTTVGVRVIDDATLEIDFNDQAVYNLQIAGLWVHAATPQWLIEGDDCTEARGDRWTETGFNQSYGPFVLKEWIHDSTLTLVKNPFWPGTDAIPSPKLDEVTFTMLDDVAAFAEYEAGNLDASAVPLADIDRVKSDPELSQQLVIGSVQCTYYYGYNTKKPPVDDVRVRRALSMAVDRQSLIDNVTKGGQLPAQWFARPGLTAAPSPEEYPDLGIKFDPEAAKAELQSYLDEKGITIADLDLTLMFNTSSGHQAIAEAIQQMWKENLGVDVKLANQEWAVYLQTLQEDSPQIWRLGWCSDYADANNFTKEVFAKGGHENGAAGAGINQWDNAQFEELVKQAALETDLAARTELYAQAEQILVYDDAVIIPIYWYTRNTVSKPYLVRTFGVGGQEALEKWDINK